MASEQQLAAGVTDSNYAIPEGRLGNLTEQQQLALDTFRTQVQSEGLFVEDRMDDALLLRFLRARKWDVAAAKQMLAECERWRRDFGVDELVAHFNFEEKKQVDEIYPQFYHKTDKEGRPVYIERLGTVDIGKLRKITTEQRQLQCLVFEYEKMLKERFPKCSEAIGHPVETSCTILDLSGVGLLQFYQVQGYVQKAAHIGQNYYPETMGKFYIVNAPWLFSKVWGVIKPWLDPVTVAKIHIPSDAKKALLEQIPAENLPYDLGGLCRCPGGCSLSDAGPWNTQSVESPQ